MPNKFTIILLFSVQIWLGTSIRITTLLCLHVTVKVVFLCNNLLENELLEIKAIIKNEQGTQISCIIAICIYYSVLSFTS